MNTLNNTPLNNSFIKYLSWMENGKLVHSPLSNFYVEADGTHVEGEFQAAKAGLKGLSMLRLRMKFCTYSPGAAKKLGRKLPLRSDWEKVKDGIMRDFVLRKFSDDPECWKWLDGTGNLLIIEGNHWHDNYWGACDCDKCTPLKGKRKNKLGFILMDVRDELRRTHNATAA